MPKYVFFYDFLLEIIKIYLFFIKINLIKNFLNLYIYIYI